MENGKKIFLKQDTHRAERTWIFHSLFDGSLLFLVYSLAESSPFSLHSKSSCSDLLGLITFDV